MDRLRTRDARRASKPGAGAETASADRPARPSAQKARRFIGSDAWFMLTLYGAVALGAAIGGAFRAISSVAAAAIFGGAFPWGTLFVNVLGSLIIGFFATLTEPGGRVFAGPRQRQFLMTGFCGGFTTFSVFSVDTLQMIQRHALMLAGVNITVSVVAWLGAVWLGHIAALRLNRLRRT